MTARGLTAGPPPVGPRAVCGGRVLARGVSAC